MRARAVVVALAIAVAVAAARSVVVAATVTVTVAAARLMAVDRSHPCWLDPCCHDGHPCCHQSAVDKGPPWDEVGKEGE